MVTSLIVQQNDQIPDNKYGLKCDINKLFIIINKK
jgi:hypothetical protein